VLEVRRDSERELEHVRRELAAMIERHRTGRRREQILQLLQEHDLPLPTSDGLLDSQLVDAGFIDTLMRAADDQTVRQLVEERARLIRSASQWTSEHRSGRERPRAKDQLECTSNKAIRNAREFAAAVRGR
jgi:hypothetical protein